MNGLILFSFKLLSFTLAAMLFSFLPLGRHAALLCTTSKVKVDNIKKVLNKTPERIGKYYEDTTTTQFLLSR